MFMKIILIAGPSGSGKTTIANKLVEYYGEDRCQKFSLDPYYIDQSHIEDIQQRSQVNYDDPSSVELALAVRHIEALKQGLTVQAPVYDFSMHTRRPEVTDIKPKDILIIEGIFALQPELIKFGDVKVYVDTDLDLCLLRRMERDVAERGRTMESVIHQYKETVRPMRIIHVEPTKQYADVIVPDNSIDFNIDISPIIGELALEEFADFVHMEPLQAVSTSVRGWFNYFSSYMTQQLETIDHAAQEFLAEDDQLASPVNKQ